MDRAMTKEEYEYMYDVFIPTQLEQLNRSKNKENGK